MFDASTHGTRWEVTGGRLVVHGVDLEAESALVAFGGGSQLLMNLSREVSDAVLAIPMGDRSDVLPLMRHAAVILEQRPSVLPQDLEPLTLWLLCTTKDPGLAQKVAEHWGTPGGALSKMARRWGSSGRAMTRLSERSFGGVDVLASVARNPNTPAGLLSGLAMSENPAVRLAAAENPATPLAELRRLQLGPAGPIRDTAARTINRLASRRVEPLPPELDL